MFHKLLGEESDDLERVTLQSRESLHIETTRTNVDVLVARQRVRNLVLGETLVERSSSRSETPSCAVKLELASKVQPPRESLEQVADDDFHKQLELSVPLYELGVWKHKFKISSFTMTTLNLLFAEAERKGKTRHFRMYIGP